jgi:site-specific recombinase XerD
MREEVDQFLTHLSIEKGLAENTISAYRTDLDRYFQINGSVNLDEESLNKFMAFERSKGKAESSIAREIVTLKKFCCIYCKRIRHIEQDRNLHATKDWEKIAKSTADFGDKPDSFDKREGGNGYRGERSSDTGTSLFDRDENK